MYELACNPDIQDKLRQEIQMTIDKYDGQLAYAANKNMSYLDKIFKETLQKYPVEFELFKVAVNDHTFTEHEFPVSMRTEIMIPVHHDPRVYLNPDNFDPGRFEKEIESLRPEMSYLPFGDGPRMCIGERFAQIEIKLLKRLIAAVKNFQLDTCEETFKVCRKALNVNLLADFTGIYLSIKKRYQLLGDNAS